MRYARERSQGTTGSAQSVESEIFAYLTGIARARMCLVPDFSMRNGAVIHVAILRLKTSKNQIKAWKKPLRLVVEK